jgi:hypothetical protein
MDFSWNGSPTACKSSNGNDEQMGMARMGWCFSFGASPLFTMDHCPPVSTLDGDEKMDQTAMA